MVVEKACKLPLYKNMLWAPKLTITTSDFWFWILFLLYHYVPAFFADIGFRLAGSKLRLMSIYSKIYYNIQLMAFFSSNSWTFPNPNLVSLQQLVSEADHKEFPFTVKGETYEHFCELVQFGCRKYFFKEDDESIAKAHTKLKILNAVHNLLMFVLYASSIYFVCCMLKPEKLIWSAAKAIRDAE